MLSGGGAPASEPATGGPRARVRSLREVLAYTNQKVVWRFQEHYEVSDAQATLIFRDMLRWLWACGHARATDGPKLSIYRCMTVLDEMWHEFILFTQDYDRFCREYLGGYIHHEPATRLEREAFQKSAKRDHAAHHAREQERLTEVMGFIHDHLGERVMYRWFRTYRRRYPTEFFNTRRLPMS